MQINRSLKPATINRTINAIKHYFYWAKQQRIIQTDYFKSTKFVPAVKTSSKQMTDKEESVLMNAFEKYGAFRDKTIIILMLHTGLRSMEAYDVQIEDIVMRKKGDTSLYNQEAK
ncbi:TPA: hypothetical protein ACQUHP_006223 [Bacillus cereus]